MGDLLFLRRCFAYRHAARIEFQKARLLPSGPDRDQVRRVARALRDLARDEAWLEGQTLRPHRNDACFSVATASLESLDRRRSVNAASDRAGVTSRAAPG